MNTTILIVSIIVIILIAIGNYIVYLTMKKKSLEQDNKYNYDTAADTRLEFLREVQGRKFYQFKNPAFMPATRHLSGLATVEYAQMGLDIPTLQDLITAILQALNKSDIASASYYTIDIRERIEKADPQSVYLTFATVYCVEKGHNPASYDREVAEEQIAFWKQDTEVAAFFLDKAFKFTRHLTTFSSNDIQMSFLMTNLERMNLIKKQSLNS
jgi:hypothetical protein